LVLNAVADIKRKEFLTAEKTAKGDNSMAFPQEPLSEDDYPDDSIVPTGAFEWEGTKVSINYIKEEGKDFYKTLNVQVEEKEDPRSD
jgi:hypothetical protein